MQICSYAEFDGKVQPLDQQLKMKAQEITRGMNRQGMRVLAVAHKSYLSKDCDFSVADENDMVLIGYLAFLDLPKQSAASAIRQLHENGIEVKILSGDNEAVVQTIARQVGIDTAHSLTGPQIERMLEPDFKRAVRETTVFSKLTPIQKSEINYPVYAVWWLDRFAATARILLLLAGRHIAVVLCVDSNY